ncbi:MAG: hypothetical protein HDQ93_04995, partial [Desulfovibrio sp.]|nr:hypothetical protein [Desulfovibrio sp.]
MTLRNLLLALAGFVSETVKDYPFPSPDGEWLDCRVFLHGLPAGQDDGTYPFVLVRWQEGEIQSMEDAKTVLRDTVALVLGVHSPKNQEQAGILCAELMDLLRRALWKQRILASRFELVEPLRSVMPEADRQQHYYHMAIIETVWNYTWPPKALEEAGQSQMRTGNVGVDSFSEAELALAKGQSKIWG